MRYVIPCLCLVILASTVSAGAAICRVEHAVVTYEGIDRTYAKAMARTLAAARAVAVEQFGFDMPETISLNVRCSRTEQVRLFNGGRDRVYLTIRSARDLRKPADSGIFHLYGLCHEVGHLAMYRTIRRHDWMTSAAAEGWAHYAGSRILDGVYAREGKDLWPDAYDYLPEGTQRLSRQLAESEPGPSARGAKLWQELARIAGDKNLPKIFSAWNAAEIKPEDPGAGLRKALLRGREDERLADWWDEAEEVLVLKRPASGFPARTAKRSELDRPTELADDDGVPSGRKSIAGSGHAVRRKTTGRGWYLTGVRIYGSRYGTRRPPAEDFRVWLCDKGFKVIAEFQYPYATFPRQGPKWVMLPIPPIEVPEEFIVSVGFNPTGTKGVFVHYDKASDGKSLTGLPGKGTRNFTQGDWLIRPQISRLKTANALKTMKTK